MMKRLKFRKVLISTISSVGLFLSALPAIAKEPFSSLRSLYTLDAHLPQTVDVLSDETSEGVRRIELTFTAFDNEKVPARLEVLQNAENPPVIILLHGLTQSRAQWWRTDKGPYSFPSRHRKALVDAGFAVFAFDARKHGDRRGPADFADPGIYLQNGYFDAARKFIAETAIDVRSAINALDRIDGIDASNIGVTGFSLGAFIGYLATAVDTRIDAGFFMALPLLPVTKGEVASFTSPFAYAEGFDGRVMGLLAGTKDQLYTKEGIDSLAAAMRSDTQVTWIESDHDFPDSTADISVNFFETAF